MQFNQSENFFTDYIQGYLYVLLTKYTLQHFSDGWWRRECLILANITIFCNCGTNKLLAGLSAIVLNITALLVRLAETITMIYRNKIILYRNIKILWFLFPRKRIYSYSTCMHYDYVVPLLLYCTKLGYFFLQLQLTKGALFSGLRYLITYRY